MCLVGRGSETSVTYASELMLNYATVLLLALVDPKGFTLLSTFQHTAWPQKTPCSETKHKCRCARMQIYAKVVFDFAWCYLEVNGRLGHLYQLLWGKRGYHLQRGGGGSITY